MPTRQLDKAETRDIVRMAVEALGERQRMAVLLSKFEELSYADIAEQLDIGLSGAMEEVEETPQELEPRSRLPGLKDIYL